MYIYVQNSNVKIVKVLSEIWNMEGNQGNYENEIYDLVYSASVK